MRWTHDETGERVYELYDLVNDPGETRNVASDKPAVVKELDAILDRQPKPKPLPKPKGKA
ncbi:hypothetical protein A8V01_22690 [Novosphingobium guangzhouense]|uniref:N-sulphoglucosamine sulphohydrolase C-terminal domain-containing protein n=1 Tax=Novosphingobium guangzhouense TaxID=1850347 RepID=A0A2K2FY87_9SPHN|nr:hypothetical protein A8V01_22690 [Novosphingobium guangzhouense]